jgi:hypothetical protein
MACEIWGEEYNFNNFQISSISWVFSTVVSEEQDFSVFLPPCYNSVAQETSQKWPKLFIGMWWGVYYYYYYYYYYYISEAVGFIVLAGHQWWQCLCHQHCNSRTVTLCFDFVPPWLESPLYVSVLLSWRL